MSLLNLFRLEKEEIQQETLVRDIKLHKVTPVLLKFYLNAKNTYKIFCRICHRAYAAKKFQIQ